MGIRFVILLGLVFILEVCFFFKFVVDKRIIKVVIGRILNYLLK